MVALASDGLYYITPSNGVDDGKFPLLGPFDNDDAAIVALRLL